MKYTAGQKIWHIEINKKYGWLFSGVVEELYEMVINKTL